MKPIFLEGGKARALAPCSRLEELGDFYLKSCRSHIFICALLLILAACHRPGSAKEVGAPPPRIVSLAPNLTEIVFALGMGDHLVGVTDHCNYPPEVKTKPRLGGLKNISAEAVLAQNPDLVLATLDGNEPALLDQLAGLGLKVKSYQPGNLDAVLDTILQIGRELGRKERAEQLVAELKAKRALVAKNVAGVKPAPVFLFFQREPLIAAGPGTFANSLIRDAGGINLAADAQIPYPHYSLEVVIEKAPAVIVDVSMGEVERAQKDATDYWSRWPDLPAVKAKRVFALNTDLITRPGPRIFQGLLDLAKILHPERFP